MQPTASAYEYIGQLHGSSQRTKPCNSSTRLWGKLHSPLRVLRPENTVWQVRLGRVRYSDLRWSTDISWALSLSSTDQILWRSTNGAMSSRGSVNLTSAGPLSPGSNGHTGHSSHITESLQKQVSGVGRDSLNQSLMYESELLHSTNTHQRPPF